jgi:hypothetical protein
MFLIAWFMEEVISKERRRRFFLCFCYWFSPSDSISFSIMTNGSRKRESQKIRKDMSEKSFFYRTNQREASKRTAGLFESVMSESVSVHFRLSSTWRRKDIVLDHCTRRYYTVLLYVSLLLPLLPRKVVSYTQLEKGILRFQVNGDDDSIHAIFPLVLKSSQERKVSKKERNKRFLS